MQGWEEREEAGILFEENVVRREVACKEFMQVARMEEISYR